jgi:hypothetical protein
MLGVLVDSVVGFNTVRLVVGAALVYLGATAVPSGLEESFVAVAQLVAGAIIVATCRNGATVTIDTK